jgi:hypothetical protein
MVFAYFGSAFITLLIPVVVSTVSGSDALVGSVALFGLPGGFSGVGGTGVARASISTWELATVMLS